MLDMRSVKTGAKTPALKWARKNPDARSRTFSLMFTAGDSLDFEAKTEQDRNRYAQVGLEPIPILLLLLI